MASNVPNRGTALLAVDVAFLTTAVISNALRCFVRVRMVRAFGLDDWLMMCACVSFITYCSCSIVGVQYGTGRHHADLPKDDIHTAKHYWWFCYLFYCVSMITSKVSIGWFLLRIATKRVHSLIIAAAMLISVVAGIVFFFVVMFQCEPISYFWNKSNQTGQCLHIDVIIGLGYLYSVFSIISDFTFALIPAFLVWNLRLKRSAKMALTPLLTMGCVASFAVIARMKYVTNFRSPDFLWATLDIAIWSTVEQGLAITAGSLATLRPLFHLASCKLGLTDNSHAPVRCSRNGGVLSPPNPIKSTTSTNTSILNCLRGNNVVELKAGAEARYTPGEGKEYEEYCLVAPEKAFHNQAQSSPNWYQTSFTKKMGKDKDASRVRDDNESEKSLRGKPSAASLEQHEDSRCWSEQRRNGSSDGHGHGNWNSAMQITVETTIHMSEEARHSRMSC